MFDQNAQTKAISYVINKRNGNHTINRTLGIKSKTILSSNNSKTIDIFARANKIYKHFNQTLNVTKRIKSTGIASTFRNYIKEYCHGDIIEREQKKKNKIDRNAYHISSK